MASLNKTQLIGHLGADPEIRYLPSGAPVASVSVATTEEWRDRETGEKKEKTEWHRVVFFEGLAKVVGDYLKKGALVYVEGKLRTRKWKDQGGVDRYTTEIVGQELKMLGKKIGDAPSVPPGDGVPSGADTDDDIPF